MKRYDQWDQVSPITDQDDGRYCLFVEAQAEIAVLKMFIAKYIHWDILSDAGTERARQIHLEVFPENY